MNNGTNYSIAGRKSLENIKNNTELYNEGIKSYNQAVKLSNQNIGNETIRQNTGWFQDKNGDWKYEFSDKDMSIKTNINLESSKTYKLGDILNHDTLFTVYPELKQVDVKIDNTMQVNGKYSPSDNTIALNDKLIKSNKKIEGTLIHEIQHAIQKIEEFEGGRSSKGSKLAYYKSLGEIEASDVKSRFIQEKYDNVDISKVIPESAKKNPQHKYLNNYLNNRGLLDKIEDGMYNYFDKKQNGENNYEEYINENHTKNKKENGYKENKEVEKDSTRKKYGINEKDSNQGSFSVDNKSQTLSIPIKEIIQKNNLNLSTKKIKFKYPKILLNN